MFLGSRENKPCLFPTWEIKAQKRASVPVRRCQACEQAPSVMLFSKRKGLHVGPACESWGGLVL